MNKPNTLNEIASKHLGQSGSYAVYTDKHDSSLLVPMPRELARTDWGITGEEFIGEDVWHCHEATFLTNSGIPVAGTLKFSYNSNSKYMIESKSMKLYLNSFDMCKMGSTIDLAIIHYELQITEDLSKVLETEVRVKFHESGRDGIQVDSFVSYQDLHTTIKLEQNNVEITDYNAQHSHLLFTRDKKSNEYKLFTNVLRSRCRHTKQKDTGTAYIYIKTKKSKLDLVSLFKEVVALREVNEFHEFCCEKLYTAIMATGEVESCMIALLYSRRGSLDINPIRATSSELIPSLYTNPQFYSKKTQGQ